MVFFELIKFDNKKLEFIYSFLGIMTQFQEFVLHDNVIGKV